MEGKVAQPCGEFPANPIPYNGVDRRFRFFACMDHAQRGYSCDTGPEGIRGEYLCAEFAMEGAYGDEHPGADGRRQGIHLPTHRPRRRQGLTCTCWKREAPTASTTMEGYWAFRQATDTHRVYTAADGTVVFLDQNFTYVNSAGVTVSLAAP